MRALQGMVGEGGRRGGREGRGRKRGKALVVVLTEGIFDDEEDGVDLESFSSRIKQRRLEMDARPAASTSKRKAGSRMQMMQSHRHRANPVQSAASARWLGD